MKAFLNTLDFIFRHPVNKRKKLHAITRYLKWQIGSRIVPGEILYDWIDGVRFIVRPGEASLTGNIYVGLQEFEDMAFLLHFLDKKDLFIDIGANVGSYTLLASGVKKARSISVEPIPSAFDRLSSNIKINSLEKKVKLIKKGASNKKGHLFFTLDEDSTNHVLEKKSLTNNVSEIQTSTVDQIAKGDSPNLIKIDVEGYEYPVLMGASNTLKNKILKAIIIEMNGSSKKYGYDESQILKLMRLNGFKPFSYCPIDRTLQKLKIKNDRSSNTLFIRDINYVAIKIKKSPTFRLFDSTF